jgi:hypothetical protein
MTREPGSGVERKPYDVIGGSSPPPSSQPPRTITFTIALPEAGVPDADGDVFTEHALEQIRQAIRSGDIPIRIFP